MWRGTLDYENRKTPISKPAANAHRPNVQVEITRTRLRRSSCGISWDRCVIAAAPLRWPLARYEGRHARSHMCPQEGNRRSRGSRFAPDQGGTSPIPRMYTQFKLWPFYEAFSTLNARSPLFAGTIRNLSLAPSKMLRHLCPFTEPTASVQSTPRPPTR
jgi:hypothetical protein